MTEQQSSTPGGQIPNGDDPQGQIPTQTQGQMPSDPSQKVPIESLPQPIQDYIKELRSQAKESRKQLEVEARARQATEEAKLREQGEYKKLAETHEARVRELEPIAERYTALSSLVAEQINVEVKNWPATVKALDPGPETDIETRLAWLNKARPIVSDLQLQARGTQPGNGPNPKPSSGMTPEGLANNYEQRLRASGKYSA